MSFSRYSCLLYALWFSLFCRRRRLTGFVTPCQSSLSADSALRYAVVASRKAVLLLQLETSFCILTARLRPECPSIEKRMNEARVISGNHVIPPTAPFCLGQAV
jgi:hypothetical protein